MLIQIATMLCGLTLLLGGCGQIGPAYVGDYSISGFSPDPPTGVSEGVNYYAPFDTEEQLYFLVVWRGAVNDVLVYSENNKITINGKTSSIDAHIPAVYALQTDYSLKAIPLNEDDGRHVFSLFEDIKLLPYMMEDPIWRDKVLPSLHWIPPVQQTRPSK